MATLNLINDLIANLTQNEVTKSESGIDRSIGYSQSDKYPNPSTMTVSDDTFRAQMPKQSHPSHPIAKTITPDAKPSFQTKSQRKRKGMESKDENETQINEDVVEEEHLQLSPFTIYILKKFEEKYNITLKPTIENHHHMLPNDFLLVETEVDRRIVHWSELDVAESEQLDVAEMEQLDIDDHPDLQYNQTAFSLSSYPLKEKIAITKNLCEEIEAGRIIPTKQRPRSIIPFVAVDKETSGQVTH
eukprot:181795_1